MNVFDMIGPVMIGPSSSHTAGAARLGLAARNLLGERPLSAELLLHGSFAKTYRGHGTDKALVAGILGLSPDDDRLRHSLTLAREQGLPVRLTAGEVPGAEHPNTVRITLTGASGRSVAVQGASVGGGNIRVTRLDGLEMDLTGEAPTLVVAHNDTAGVIAAVTEALRSLELNIGGFRLTRAAKRGLAVMTVELDSEPPANLVDELSLLPNVLRVIFLAVERRRAV